MMKKAISLILCFLMILTVFAGCAKKKDENDKGAYVQMYLTDPVYNFAIAEEDFDNLAGWAGDLQTLIRYNLIPQITSTTDYNHIYEKMSICNFLEKKIKKSKKI